MLCRSLAILPTNHDSEDEPSPTGGSMQSRRFGPIHGLNTRYFVCSVQITLGWFGARRQQGVDAGLTVKARWATEGQPQSSSTQTSHIPPWPLLESHNWNPYFLRGLPAHRWVHLGCGRGALWKPRWNLLLKWDDASSWSLISACGWQALYFCVVNSRRQRAVSCARPWTMRLWVVIRLYKVKMIHSFLKMYTRLA